MLFLLLCHENILIGQPNNVSINKKGVNLMVNESFDEFIKSEAKHKSQYLGSKQPSHGNYKNDEEINSRTNTDDSVGADGRDIFK